MNARRRGLSSLSLRGLRPLPALLAVLGLCGALALPAFAQAAPAGGGRPGGPLRRPEPAPYNPQSRQWSLNFASSRGGTLTTPTIGEFVDGVGTFHDQELFDGRAVFVRFVITPLDADTIRFEQAFSADGGRTWEVNWVATDTRME